MASDRIKKAIGRIERALDRIEQAPPQPTAAAPRREQAVEALRSLDSLIAELKAAQEKSPPGKSEPEKPGLEKGNGHG